MTNQQFPGQPDPNQPQGAQYSQEPPIPPTAPAQKPKKPWFKRVWVWVVAAVLVIAIAVNMGDSEETATDSAETTTASTTEESSAETEAEATGEPEPAEEPAAEQEQLTLDEGWELDKSNQFMAMVNGYVSNNGEAITNYVQITFDVLDAEGANLGTCLANTNTIDAGGKWKFEAICDGEPDEIADVRFKEITGF